MEYQNWSIRKENQILRLSLQRSDMQNNLNLDTMRELREITRQIREDDSTQVVILQGEGRHFSIGVDVRMLARRMELSLEENRSFLAELQRCVDDFERLGKPTIAKLQGFCIGGGLILSLCCDFRIASKRTVFSLPEIKLGLPILWGTQRVIRAVGIPIAKEILYIGGRFKAGKALHYGLIHQIVEPDELDQAVLGMANRLLDVPTKALELSKQIIHAGGDLTLRESQDLELEIVADLLVSTETRNAVIQYAKDQGLLE